MKILLIGGTGIISTACTELAIARGFDVTLVNRSGRSLIPGARTLAADINDPGATATALGSGRWDAVVDFLAFTPEQIEQRIALFRARTGQYLFISSASAYQKPLRGHPFITESTPLVNPLWDYSRQKIAGEDRLLRALREESFPVTIVRPSLTYGDTVIPLAVNSWANSYTVIDRLRRGQPVIIPGDGLTLWTITHNSDFAKGLIGLLGHGGAIGHAFHITSDEALTWNELYQQTSEAAGVRGPSFIHIASDFITAVLPGLTGSLLGDKSHTALFDNTKIKRFVPEYTATTGFRTGIARTLAWFDADPARRTIDTPLNVAFDRLISAYQRGLVAAQTEFSRQG